MCIMVLHTIMICNMTPLILLFCCVEFSIRAWCEFVDLRQNFPLWHAVCLEHMLQRGPLSDPKSGVVEALDPTSELPSPLSSIAMN